MAEQIPFSHRSTSSAERMKRHDEAILEKVWQQKYFTLESTRGVDLTGVMHKPLTFETHHEDIELAIRNSAVVMLEGYMKKDMPDHLPEDFPNDQDISAFRDELARLKASGVTIPVAEESITDQVIRRELILYHERAGKESDYFYDFYDKVRRLAALHKKPIAVFDPMHAVQERKEEWKAAGNRKVFSTKNNLLNPEGSIEENIRESALYGGLIAAATGYAVARLASKSELLKMSRRRFLGYAGAGAVAASVGGMSELAEKFEDVAQKAIALTGRESNPLGVFRYNATTDYREVVTGLAIQRLDTDMKSRGIRGDIAVFFGSAHIESIEHYAKAPIEARLRLRAYPQQTNFAEPSLAIYDFDAQKSVWELRSTESLMVE